MVELNNASREGTPFDHRQSQPPPYVISGNNQIHNHNNNNNSDININDASNNNNNNFHNWADVPAIVVNDCSQRLPHHNNSISLDIDDDDSDSADGGPYRPTTCPIVIDSDRTANQSSISTINFENLDHRRSSKSSAVSRVLEMQNEDDKYRHMIRDILRSDSLMSTRSSNGSSCSTRTALPPVEDIEICSINGDELDDHDLMELVSISKNNAETNTTQSLLQLSMVRQNSETSQRPSLATKSINKSSRNFWDKICDYSHRITRYVNIVDICAIVAAFLLSSMVLLWLGTITSKTVLISAIAWIALCLFYYAFPILKRWFYYWDPDFSLFRPT